MRAATHAQLCKLSCVPSHAGIRVSTIPSRSSSLSGQQRRTCHYDRGGELASVVLGRFLQQRGERHLHKPAEAQHNPQSTACLGASTAASGHCMRWVSPYYYHSHRQGGHSSSSEAGKPQWRLTGSLDPLVQASLSIARDWSMMYTLA